MKIQKTFDDSVDIVVGLEAEPTRPTQNQMCLIEFQRRNGRFCSTGTKTRLKSLRVYGLRPMH